MRFFLTLFLAFVLVFIGVQAYRLYGQKADLAQKGAALEAQASALVQENRKFTGDIEYFQRDINVGKELQSKFNYRKPDEKMMILVPAPQGGPHE